MKSAQYPISVPVLVCRSRSPLLLVPLGQIKYQQYRYMKEAHKDSDSDDKIGFRDT